MKLYFALSYTPFFEMNLMKDWDVENVLVSYYVLRHKLKGEDKNIECLNEYKDSFNFFLDSGAFSAYAKKVTINLDEYIEFIKKTKDIWKVYANLDVIGDWKATRDNQEYMESKGLSPLPVFHFDSPLDELRRLCEKYDYIALGGLVPLALQKEKLERWLDICFSIIKDYWVLKVHGFGVNSLPVWKKYPFHSVDATSWNIGARYAKVIKFEDGKIKGVNQKNDKMGHLKHSQNSHWKYRYEKSISSYAQSCRFVTKLWEAKGIKI